MAIAINLNQKEYILESDRELPAEKQTKFFIKPLSAKQAAVLQDSMKFSGEGTIMQNMGTNTLEMLKIGLVGWENFVDAEGNQIKFTKNMDENIDRLAVAYRYELASAIMELSNFGDKEVKN